MRPMCFRSLLLLLVGIAAAACSSPSEGSDSDETADKLVTEDAPATPALKRGVIIGYIFPAKPSVKVAGLLLKVGCPTLAAQEGGEATTDATGAYSLLAQVKSYGICEGRLSNGERTGEPFRVGVAERTMKIDFRVDENLAVVGGGLR